MTSWFHRHILNNSRVKSVWILRGILLRIEWSSVVLTVDNPPIWCARLGVMIATCPSGYELSSWIIKEEVETTNKILNKTKPTWKKIRVSLLSNGMSDIRSRSLINFLVNNQHDIGSLKTIDDPDFIKYAQKLFELLDDVIEENGEDIVVQVNIDNTSTYKITWHLSLEKKKSLYWTSYVHFINLMLEKIQELLTNKNPLLKENKVCKFIHNHQWVQVWQEKLQKMISSVRNHSICCCLFNFGEHASAEATITWHVHFKWGQLCLR